MTVINQISPVQVLVTLLNLLALAELFHVKPEELLGQRNGA